MLKKTPKILCVGALTCDSLYRLDQMPSGEGKFLASGVIHMASGMAANAATAASRQGAEVSLWASVGEDTFANILIAEIKKSDINCSAVRRTKGGKSATAAIVLDPKGEKLVIAHYDPITQTAPDALPFSDLGDFDAVLSDTRWPEASVMALMAAREAGLPAILDADVSPLTVLEKLMPLASHIIASQSGAKIISGSSVALDHAVARISFKYNCFAAITAGSEGVYWHDPSQGGVRYTKAIKVESIDTLAAGDVFHGVFAFAIGAGMPLEDSIRHSVAAAALKCKKFGGRLGSPSYSETVAILERNP